MGRKRNPVLPIFTRDILSSPRCRALSASAAGVYFFLLCRMNEPPQPGAYRLSDWEQHPNWRRSKTQQCLATADKYERLQYFAALLAKNDLPWRQKDILSGLQELYDFGILTVEGDMLIQPRMYKDNGFVLPDLDGDGAPEGTILDDPTSGSMASKDGSELSENSGAKNGTQKRTKKGTEKVQRKVRLSPAPASRIGIELEKKNNNISIKGGMGEIPNNDPTGFWQFWDLYDKKLQPNNYGNLAVANVRQEWLSLTDDERADVMDFLPAYVKATPTKKWRMHPGNFLKEKAWKSIQIERGVIVNAKREETQENTPTASETPQISTNGGKVGQLSTEKEKPRQKPLKSKSATADQSQTKQKSEVADNPPTLADVQAYADERAQQGKPFLYVTPEEFFNTCEMDGWKRKGKPLFNWKAYMLRFEQYRKDHGEPTIEQRGQSAPRQPQTIPKPDDPVPATKSKPHKYKDKW